MTLFALRLFLFTYLIIYAANLLLLSDRQANLPVPKSSYSEAIVRGNPSKDKAILVPCAPAVDCDMPEAEAEAFSW